VAGSNAQPLHKENSDEDIHLLNQIRNGYKDDKLFKFVVGKTKITHPSWKKKGYSVEETLKGRTQYASPRIGKL
jgi:hypothetical protein